MLENADWHLFIFNKIRVSKKCGKLQKRRKPEKISGFSVGIFWSTRVGNKARSPQGSGLGLAIAQTYTESVGGTFHVSVDGDQFNAIVELPKTERVL